jgi:hypothetical protein
VGLILDSSVAIAAERRGDTVQAFLQRVIDAASNQEPLYPPSVSLNSFTAFTVRTRPNGERDVKHSSRIFWRPSPFIR